MRTDTQIQSRKQSNTITLRYLDLRRLLQINWSLSKGGGFQEKYCEKPVVLTPGSQKPGFIPTLSLCPA